MTPETSPIIVLYLSLVLCTKFSPPYYRSVSRITWTTGFAPLNLAFEQNAPPPNQYTLCVASWKYSSVSNNHFTFCSWTGPRLLIQSPFIPLSQLFYISVFHLLWLKLFFLFTPPPNSLFAMQVSHPNFPLKVEASVRDVHYRRICLTLFFLIYSMMWSSPMFLNLDSYRELLIHLSRFGTLNTPMTPSSFQTLPSKSQGFCTFCNFMLNYEGSRST